MFSAPTEYGPDAAGQPRAGEDRNRVAGVRQADVPAEEQAHVLRRVLRGRRPPPPPPPGVAAAAELEDAGVLEEEVALLGKEQAEARQVDLLLVGLDLREVGVDREVQRQARRHAVLHVEPGVEIAVGRGRADRVGAAERIRLDAQVRARASARAALERAGQRHALEML